MAGGGPWRDTSRAPALVADVNSLQRAFRLNTTGAFFIAGYTRVEWGSPTDELVYDVDKLYKCQVRRAVKRSTQL